MSVKKLSKEELIKLVNSLIASQKVYGVAAKGDKFDYAQLEDANDLRLDYDVTLLPPKKYFQPQHETLVTFKGQGDYKAVFDDEKFVVVGVHPYDIVAISQMDKLFSQDYYDEHYMTRRNNATIIACDVANASENVFASCMGTATVKSGFDVLLTDTGDGYVAEAATEKGEALLSSAADASDDDLKKRAAVQETNDKELNKHQLKCKPSDIPGLLDKAYKNPIWEKKAETCFSCGSCNIVCPTCYCFNVQDKVDWDLSSGCRERSWDGCLLDGFTKCAPDHEFRAKKADRFRHRIYRKGKYVPEKIGGEISCVGCGRCIKACLPDIANPVAVYNQLVDELGV